MATESTGVNLDPLTPANVPISKPWYVQHFPDLMIAVDLAFVFGLALISLSWPRLSKVFRAKGSALSDHDFR